MKVNEGRFAQTFRGIQRRFSALYARFLEKEAMTLTQYTLLNLLNDTGKMSMREASDRLHITKPAVTYIADQLEQRGFLKRLNRPEDRRVFLLEIQARGRRMVERAQELSLKILMETLESFNEKEKEAVGKFYDLLSVNMDGVLFGSAKKGKTKSV